MRQKIAALKSLSLSDQHDALEIGIEKISNKKGFTLDETKNTATLTSPKQNRIGTLDELLKKAQVDTDIWEVDRYVINSWEVGSKVDERIIVEPLFQIKAWLKRNLETSKIKLLIRELKTDLKSKAPEYPEIKYGAFNQKEQMLQINIFDLHFGKLAWAKETGDNYDHKIASEQFKYVIKEHLKRTKHYKIQKILFPIGNDFFNSDNLNNTTTRGTQQDEDVRWQKTFLLGRQLMVWGIDTLSKIAPVEVIVIQGNHDWERSFYLGDALECYYHKCNNVIIKNEPTPRKYIIFGSTLLGFTHGNNEKTADLPLLMAQEKPELWSKTKYREWHLGHLHHKKQMQWQTIGENKGCTVRYMSSISGTDAWHNQKGYKGALKSSESFIWSKKTGLICQNLVTIS